METRVLSAPQSQDDDRFHVFVPGAFELIEKADAEKPEAVRRIGGWCSTEELDRQGEVVVAKGLDFTDFVKHGCFNDNHRQDTDAILGYPTDARLEKGRWWTEGFLLSGYGPADRIWELAKALQRSGDGRRLGFSIEGRVVERDGRNKILRAKIRDVAITRVPVNPSCSWGVLAKSFAEPSAIEEAAEKALTANYQSPRMDGSAALRTEEIEARAAAQSGLGFEDVVKMVRRRWPHLDDHTVKRAARYAFTARSKED